jgi:hypothetical protein
LPVLPRFCRGVGERWPASDLHLHDLPFADLDQRADADAAAAESGRRQTDRLEPNRVNDLLDYVYFNHSIHIAKGVGCSSYHWEVDRMPLTHKAASLTMQFCLDCHRDAARDCVQKIKYSTHNGSGPTPPRRPPR